MRESANASKKEIEEKHKGKPYWMTCPKCGTALGEEVLEKIVRVDSCSNCGGTYVRPRRARTLDQVPAGGTRSRYLIMESSGHGYADSAPF
jgi:NAD-dependent SIR2 family protein deacetylase